MFMGTVPRVLGNRSDTEQRWVHPVLAWDFAFWFLLMMTTMGAWIVSDGAGNWPALVSVLVVLGVAYHFVGRRAAETGDRRLSDLYCLVLAACCGLATAFVASAAFLLFIALPQAWHLGRTFLRGLFWSGMVLGAVALGTLANQGFTLSTLTSMVPWLAITMVVTIGLGVSIERLVQQSDERGRLIQELKRTRAELAEANHAAGVAAERERVAREIHDTLAQGFTSIVMLAQAGGAQNGSADPRLLGMIEETARDNLAEARALVAAFTPVDLDGSTLPAALQRLGDRFGRETGTAVEVRLALGEQETAALPPVHQVVLLRAAQEALANVRKHADAERVVITLDGRGDGVAIEVDDDGRGFDPAARRNGGFGLAGMRGRVEESGGSVSIDSTPGAGTRIQVRLPASPTDTEVAS